VITLIYRFVLALALFLSVGAARAQIIEDTDLRPEGTSVVLQIRFQTPVQYTKNVSSRSIDLVQAFYEVVPTKNLLNLVFGQRLTVGGRGLPDITVVDESAGQGGERSRKLVISFARPMAHSVRAGRGGRSIEVVFPKAAQLLMSAGTTQVQLPPGEDATTAYAVTLISAADQNFRSVSTADLPQAYRRLGLETVRRVVDGSQRYEVRLGMFGTRQEAVKAADELKSRFPQVVVISQTLTAPAAADEAASAGANAALTQQQIEERAARYLDLAKKSESAGKLDQALLMLNRVLDLPPNRSSAEAQLTIGIVRIERGEYVRGRAELELFISQYPKHSKVDQARSIISESWSTEKTAKRKEQAPVEGRTTGVLGFAYYGGESKVRTQDFADSVVSALPVLLSDNEISTNPQRMTNTNLDLTWRRRDQDEDLRLVFRDNYQRDITRDLNKNRLSAMYLDYRSFVDGASIKLGRQSPGGVGVISRFDGAQAGYTLLPKFRANAVIGRPADKLMDTQRYFYGASLEAEALTQKTSGSLYFNRGMIDGVVDRNAFGTELRYFDGGLNASFLLDYDTLLKVVNIGTIQGAWQLESGTAFNFTFDRRMVSMLTLSNALYFALPPTGCPLTGVIPSTQIRSISGLLACYGTLADLREYVHEVTAMYSQGALGVVTPLSVRWQIGGSLGFVNIGRVAAVPDIMPEQPGTGNMLNGMLQLIGSNLYSNRDSSVLSLSRTASPIIMDANGNPMGGIHGTMLSYNNSTGFGERWQIDPALRFYYETNPSAKTERVSPSLRMSYKVTRQFSADADFSYEHTAVSKANQTQTTRAQTYSIGARYDF
jgi:tetratricopeptide (TPR) repeat protein